jgi:lipoprotein-releasing system permease protein
LRGIVPEREQAGRLAASLVEGRLADLVSGTERVMAGRGIASQLGLGLGDTITVLVPATNADGVPNPRLREFTVAGVIDATVEDYDSLLITSLDDVRALLPNADQQLNLYVNFRDALSAPVAAEQLRGQLPPGTQIRDWTVDHASYFRAIRIEKTMVAIMPWWSPTSARISRSCGRWARLRGASWPSSSSRAA